ncbi:hypothetical protein, partial [Staphylococcus aureus]|uniref:hypothetical protein n=1 Tax=Staphylococcus aureus TaxID=1280 RepID=UPI0038B3DE6A
MKSSAHKALASLQHKHHALIRQHGSLKNELKTLQAARSTPFGSLPIPTRMFAADFAEVEQRAP